MSRGVPRQRFPCACHQVKGRAARHDEGPRHAGVNETLEKEPGVLKTLSFLEEQDAARR